MRLNLAHSGSLAASSLGRDIERADMAKSFGSRCRSWPPAGSPVWLVKLFAWRISESSAVLFPGKTRGLSQTSPFLGALSANGSTGGGLGFDRPPVCRK